MGLGGELRRGCLAGSNGPDWLVRDDKFASFLGGDGMEGTKALAAEYIFGQPRFAFFQNLADANDWGKSSFKRGFELEIHHVISLTEILAAFGMANDCVGTADREQHAGADFAGISALLFPVQILGADCHIRSLDSIHCSTEINVRRANDDFIAIVVCCQGKKVTKEGESFIRRFVHLPIGSDEFLSHGDPFTIRYEKTELRFCNCSAARVYVRKIVTSKRINRTRLTWLVEARASTVEEIAIDAASEAGYPKAPVEIAGKDRELTACRSARRIDSRWQL